MHQIKIKDQKFLADCLAHSTDDPLTVIRFIEKFRELYAHIYTGSPLFQLEVEANAKLDAQAEIAMGEAYDWALLQSKDRRVS